MCAGGTVGRAVSPGQNELGTVVEDKDRGKVSTKSGKTSKVIIMTLDFPPNEMELPLRMLSKQ